MFSSLAFNWIAPGHRLGNTSILILSGVLLIALLAAGCGDGGGEKSKTSEGDSLVLATVGSEEITAAYYEDKLLQMENNELSKKTGKMMDTATDEGKLSFLEILINKEIMYQKALQLDYKKDAGIDKLEKTMLEYEGGLAMFSDVVENVSRTISDEELQDFYAQMGTEYFCNYVICNEESDALEAREFALTGADWEDVVDKFHDGVPKEGSKYEIKIPFGQYGREFEDLVFATQEGGISVPIPSSYGFWVLRVNKISKKPKPDLDKARDQILDVVHNRKYVRTRQDFKDQVHEKYELNINEIALKAIFEGLPEGGLMDPETNKPFKREDLLPLEVGSKYLGELLYSYKENKDKMIEFYVSDYKVAFDKMNVFQRPKRSEMLGGFRQKLISEVERGLFNLEVEDRGYFERSDVVAKVELKVEEAIVTRLYNDVVTFDDQIKPEQMEEFWAEHKSEYQVPEARNGRMVVCRTRSKADSARQAILDGTPWRKILVEFGTEASNKAKGGKVENIHPAGQSVLVEPIFSLEKGGLSQPFAFDGVRYALVQLDNIVEAHEYEMTEVNKALRGRILNVRKEAAFEGFLEKWKVDFPVKIYSENLAGLKSWDELNTVSENLEPIN